MRKLKFLIAVMLIGAICFCCQKTEQDHDVKTSERSALQDPNLNFEKEIQETNYHIQQIDAFKAQLAQLNTSSRECMDVVIVPDDVSTIQQAIFHVCDYGEIIVQAGTYNEEQIMIVNKPGIHIRADGNVVLIGDFTISHSDDVIIEGFNIVLPDYTFAWDAIWLNDASGCVIKNNSISNQAYPGQNFWDRGITVAYGTDNNMVKDNQIIEMEYGIWLYNPYTFCTNNIIQGNFLSHVYRAIYIRLDCDNNIIQSNLIDNSVGFVHRGISIIGAHIGDNEYFIENNHVKQNQVYNTASFGISMTIAFDNTIGPNNVCNNNGWHGISLWEWAWDNHVVNNEAIDNVGYDIWNAGQNNTFQANTYGTAFGL